MHYADLFQNGSLKFIKELVEKIVYQGFGASPDHPINQQVVLLVSTFLVVFLLYKLVWIVWETIKFVLNKLEW